MKRLGVEKKMEEGQELWDNVNYDYPSCGGSIGVDGGDGLLIIKNLCNLQGHSSDRIQVYTGLTDGLINKLTGEEGEMWNESTTYLSALLDGHCHDEMGLTLLLSYDGHIVE